jgi:adenosylcobinamide kinase / adenosylcobinamide-phosphate guanylyltransferase
VITLVLGGARSGKSEMAERLAAAAAAPDVTYVATGVVGDADMAGRVAAHRRRRPAGWRTVEPGADVVDAVRQAAGTVLVDSLTTWVAEAKGFGVDADGLCRALRDRDGDSVVVSDEVEHAGEHQVGHHHNRRGHRRRPQPRPDLPQPAQDRTEPGTDHGEPGDGGGRRCRRAAEGRQEGDRPAHHPAARRRTRPATTSSTSSETAATAW